MNSSMGMLLQLSHRDHFCPKFQICVRNIDSLGEGTALLMNREVVGQMSFSNGSWRKLDSWARGAVMDFVPLHLLSEAMAPVFFPVFC